MANTFPAEPPRRPQEALSSVLCLITHIYIFLRSPQHFSLVSTLNMDLMCKVDYVCMWRLSSLRYTQCCPPFYFGVLSLFLWQDLTMRYRLTRNLVSSAFLKPVEIFYLSNLPSAGDSECGSLFPFPFETWSLLAWYLPRRIGQHTLGAHLPAVRPSMRQTYPQPLLNNVWVLGVELGFSSILLTELSSRL